MKINILTTLTVSAILFIACEQEAEKPVIEYIELGLNNSKTAIIGSDFHIEASVIAEAKMDYIAIDIHADGDEKSTADFNTETAWSFDSIYTEGITGLKNTTFHKHIPISAFAVSGDYHIHFSVTDLDGNQTSIEDLLVLEAPHDSVQPVVVADNVPVTNQVFSEGEVISISGTISDDIALGGMYIGLVREDQLLSDSQADATNTITLLHTHDFSNPLSYDFTATITVGDVYDNNIEPKELTGDLAWQSGNYYLLVKCVDAFGGNWTFSEHYPIAINY